MQLLVCVADITAGLCGAQILADGCENPVRGNNNLHGFLPASACIGVYGNSDGCCGYSNG